MKLQIQKTAVKYCWQENSTHPSKSLHLPFPIIYYLVPYWNICALSTRETPPGHVCSLKVNIYAVRLYIIVETWHSEYFVKLPTVLTFLKSILLFPYSLLMLLQWISVFLINVILSKFKIFFWKTEWVYCKKIADNTGKSSTENGSVSLIDCWPISPLFPSNRSEIGQYEPPFSSCHQWWVQHRETPAQSCLYWAPASSQLLTVSPGGMTQLVSESNRLRPFKRT